MKIQNFAVFIYVHSNNSIHDIFSSSNSNVVVVVTFYRSAGQEVGQLSLSLPRGRSSFGSYVRLGAPIGSSQESRGDFGKSTEQVMY